jgi:hypothetical protein
MNNRVCARAHVSVILNDSLCGSLDRRKTKYVIFQINAFS